MAELQSQILYYVSRVIVCDVDAFGKYRSVYANAFPELLYVSVQHGISEHLHPGKLHDPNRIAFVLSGSVAAYNGVIDHFAFLIDVSDNISILHEMIIVGMNRCKVTQSFF